MKLLDVEIVENKMIANGIYLLSFESEYLAKAFKPGNFVNILIEKNSIYPLLRRPFSISFVKENKVFIGYKVVGIGTQILSQKKKGDTLNVLGPLGNSFLVERFDGKVAVVGGGVGIFPLLSLCHELKKVGNEVDVFLGFRSKSDLFFVDEFEKVADNLFISTDDGSIGFKGNTVEFFKTKVGEENYRVAFSCGPKPMLSAIKSLNLPFKCYVSLEEKMACGIGACLCCSIKGKEDNMLHVCSDGPVFDIMEVDI
ncbi:dihydroorotate dehydrogenase electron transfer subunit [Caldicellulosiruptor morganii]|uniref:Dihydroorotate dehydrogenase B (NAD(+)), electron transfer subunit n=1 Tax=Caldicellulosiruptor morganii TaxID=1387555 RepID=A0ABY7BMN1_9FIRM|nr:dihydroorotate dehydrogenase electron transfer subunit [Caldicellulosiruptor morganii]WAM32811.1 dihydroorotate dehydrogenase electron transfer subunit [Caldicellulosiruptor morganii]